MKKIISKTIGNLANEAFEVYWLAGFAKSQKMDWHVRAVFRGLQSGAIHQQPLPIGLLPILTLGALFEHGEYQWDRARGEMGTVTVPDVGSPAIITSADIAPALYRFPSQGGVQRLFRYQTPQGEILIPVVELVRHLFIPNRKLAQSVMRSGALNLLYYPQEPGFQETCELHFTREMPHRLLSRRFAKEFGWIALDPEARKAWDSIYRQTDQRDYVMFTPPAIKGSRWRFRGLHHGNQWLILELLSLGGRQAPFRELHFTHPRFERTVKVRAEDSETSESQDVGEVANEAKVEIAHEFEIEDSSSGSTSESNMQLVEAPIEYSEIIGCERVTKETLEVQESATPSSRDGSTLSTVQTIRETKLIKVSADERDDTAELPPIEFRGFESAQPETMGDLKALDKTVRHMRDELPNRRFAQALVALKPGRAFSVIGERPRPAMVVMIQSIVQNHAPIVLLDVERTGVLALSLMALRFKNPLIAMEQMERAVRTVLDGLVDSGGCWSHEAEEEIADFCECERLPKALTPRGEDPWQARIWALRLIDRLELKP